MCLVTGPSLFHLPILAQLLPSCDGSEKKSFPFLSLITPITGSLEHEAATILKSNSVQTDPGYFQPQSIYVLTLRLPSELLWLCWSWLGPCRHLKF